MTDEERVEIFNQLAEILREEGFGWAVDDVAANIHLGRPEPKSVKLLKEDIDQSGFLSIEPFEIKTTGKRVELVTVVPYSEKERLGLLLGALRQISINAFEIQTTISRGLLEMNAPADFEFTDDDRDTPVVEINLLDVSRLQDTINKLRSLVGELETEAYAD